MAVVERGQLSGVRGQDYSSYTRTVDRGQAQTIRRTASIGPRQTGGGTKGQKDTRTAFTIAEQIYKRYNELQRDFFRRVQYKKTERDKYGRETEKILSGKSFAMFDIMETLTHRRGMYEAPLPFCICASDCQGNPVTGVTLTILPKTLRVFDYEEESDLCGCFAPSAVAPKHEPYFLQVGEAKYGPWTAKQVHDTRKLCIYVYTQICPVVSGSYYVPGTVCIYTCKLNFEAYQIKKTEIDARIPLRFNRSSTWDAEIFITVNGTEIYRRFCSYGVWQEPKVEFKGHNNDEVKVWLTPTEGWPSRVAVQNMTVEGINIY
jgi:hypothetical protein